MILSKKRITKVLIRLREYAGWSVPVLVANPRRQVFSRQGPNVMPVSINFTREDRETRNRPNNQQHETLMCHSKMQQETSFVMSYLFVYYKLILYIPVNIFSVKLGSFPALNQYSAVRIYEVSCQRTQHSVSCDVRTSDPSI